jgi:hypothetical protein
VNRQKIESAVKDPLFSSQSPFALKKARAWATEPDGELIWHDIPKVAWPDYLVFYGYHARSQNHPFVLASLCQIRGELRPGFVMHSLHASASNVEWAVSMVASTTLRIRCGLTELASRGSQNGLKFLCVAIDLDGNEHVLADETFKRGDARIHDQVIRLEHPVKAIRFVHDSLGNGSGDDFWIYPEVLTSH